MKARKINHDHYQSPLLDKKDKINSIDKKTIS